MRKLKHSQNFIKDKNLVDYLISKSGITPHDIVLEIGTGTGVITEQLCKATKKVISIEKDPHLYKASKIRLQKFSNLQLVNTDFMKYQLPDFKYKCFSNIPFNYTADIVKKLLLNKNPPHEAYLFIQKESAEKFLGKFKSYHIHLLLAPLFKSNITYKFKNTDFDPAPHVQVVVVSFKKRLPPDINKGEYKLYRDFITYSLNQWKQSIKRTFLKIFSYKQLVSLSKELRFTFNAKPSHIKYKQWLGLFRFIQSHRDQIKTTAFEGFYRQYMHRQGKRVVRHRTTSYNR